MKSNDLRSLLLKMNDYLIRCLDTATGRGINQGHYEITMEHLLLTMLDDTRGDVPHIIQHYGVEQGRVTAVCNENIEMMRTGNPGKPKLSPLLTDLFQEAWMVTSLHHKEEKLRSGALLDVFIGSELIVSIGLWDQFKSVFQEDLRANFHSIVEGSIENVTSSASEKVPQEVINELPKGATVLDQYTVNITEQAQQGKIDPILGRDDEIIQIVEVLSRRKKSNPIVLGEPGVGKTAVVEGLALKVAANEVPDTLKGVHIRSLDLGALQAGTKMRGEFEKRLKAVIDEIMSSPVPIILFIDEAHTLIGAGNTAGGSDAANLLKPALARGELRTIAATTYMEYNKYFAKDAALERRFQPIHIEEPVDDKAMLMLRGIKQKYESFHGIYISDLAIETAVRLSRRYISGRQLPDKAVDLLDTAATRVKMSLTNKPPKLELLISELDSVQLEMEMVQKDHDLNIKDNVELLKELGQRKDDLEKSITKETSQWENEVELVKNLVELRKKKTNPEEGEEVADIDIKIADLGDELSQVQGDSPMVFADVTDRIVAEVIESWTGIPVGNMTRDEMVTLTNLEAELRKRVVGQDHAIKQIADAIRGAKVGLKKEDGPIGVFLLVGTSGVGKTELARATAEVLFGDERFMVTLNMTEYKNEYNTSRLIGADPGLVGYGEGGALSEPVRQRPYSVVLLDEVEKANHSVMDLFMQVFDRGMLQDSDRRQIDFTNTLIFMTSNLASEVIFENYNEGMESPDELLEELRPYMNQYFRPEFLGRIKPIVFLPLGAEVMKLIVQIKLGKLAKRLERNQRMQVTFADHVYDWVTSACTRAETGARNIDAIVDRTLVPEIAAKLLAFMADGEAPASLHVEMDEDDQFIYNFN